MTNNATQIDDLTNPLTLAAKYVAMPVDDLDAQAETFSMVDVGVLALFNYGSIIDCEKRYNESIFHTFATMDEFLEWVDASNEVIAGNHDKGEFFEYVGNLTKNGDYADAPFELYNTTVDEEEYERGSTDIYPDGDSVPVVYRVCLEPYVGKRVKIRAVPIRYTEQRVTPRGNYYHVEADYLLPASVSEA